MFRSKREHDMDLISFLGTWNSSARLSCALTNALTPTKLKLLSLVCHSCYFRVRCLLPVQRIKADGFFVDYASIVEKGKATSSGSQCPRVITESSVYFSQASHYFKIINASVSSEIRGSWRHLGWRSLGQIGRKRRSFEWTIIWGCVLNKSDVTRYIGLLAVETMHAIVQWLPFLNIKRNMTSMFVNKKHRYSLSSRKQPPPIDI